MSIRAVFKATLIGMILLGTTGASATDVVSTLPAPDEVWRQPAGLPNSTKPDAPLPFQNEAEILDFLRTAEVIDRTPIRKGVNGFSKFLLEKDGVRAHAVFRDVDRTKRNTLIGGRPYPVFRDSYLFEPAAYELAKLLGIHNVPPAVLREFRGRKGSMQLWIENVRDRKKDGFDPPSVAAWLGQIRDMVFFDNLIFNSDRNTGNQLTTQDYRLMMIDHTRAFQPVADLVSPERLMHANRQTWERLRELTNQEIAETLRPFLTPNEIAKLQIRRRLLLEHLEELIAARGEDVVIS